MFAQPVGLIESGGIEFSLGGIEEAATIIVDGD